MAKLVIGQAPKTFPLPVEVPTPHGSAASVEFTAKHLKSTDWAEMREAHMEAVQAEVKVLFDQARKAAEAEYQKELKKAPKDTQPDTDEQKELKISALLKPVKESEIRRLRAKHCAELIVKIADGWDLSDTFDQKSLVEMCDLYPGAADAVFTKYGEMLEGRRLGN